ncbi:MAG TPA: tetraacyldisaccharide 4'-kinase [Steroidobacteraceae bacterium]|nr:tetraacyldisaccharide 4'-kinase [Steroidobacteraceae bacterium]
MSAQSWFNRLWYRGSPPGWLVAASRVYGAASAARRAAYRRGWLVSRRVGCPVIVVGNLSVGGTGKTPLVAWLAARLAAAGRRPGIATRGYGGSSAGPRLVEPGDAAALVGDEPLLLARRTGLPVAIGRARPAAAQLLVAAGCDVVVSDDGLQHYALARDVQIVVIDGDRRFGNGRLLPAGPLRESPQRLAAVDAIVVNGGTPAAGEFAMRLEAPVAVGLCGGAAVPLASFAGRTVHAVAGIANPERFFRMLRAAGLEVTEHPLDDHATLRADDIRFPDRNPVLMTEKDAVKCTGLADERHWFVPVDASFGAADEAALVDRVMRALAAAARWTGGTASGRG